MKTTNAKINDTAHDENVNVEKVVCKVLDIREYTVADNQNLSVICERIGNDRDRMIIRGSSNDNLKMFQLLELLVPNDILILQVIKEKADSFTIVSIDIF